MRKLSVFQVDSFTPEKFKGNPAGVVLNADGLTDEQMLCIARELNNSETAFVMKPDGPDHDVRLRYFTPKTEVPVCGHATIAAHYVRAVENQLTSSTVMQKISIGNLPVTIIREDSEVSPNYTIVMTQGEIEFAPPMAAQVSKRIVTALGLHENELDVKCPIQIVSTGHSKVMIGIKSRERLNSLTPDLLTLADLSKVIGCNGYFVFTLDSEERDILTHGRMFAPAIGIDEDPVTGNANGPLGAYLVKYSLVKHSSSVFSFKGEQGYAIGRSGVIDVTVNIENGQPKQVKIGGKAVIVFKTEIEI